MSKRTSEQESSQKEVKSKTSKTEMRDKVLSTAVKADKMISDATLGKHAKDVLRVMFPREVKQAESIGKLVAAVIGADYNDLLKGKFTPREFDFTDPNWLKQTISSILSSKPKEGGK